MNLFEVTVKYETAGDAGKNKKVTEKYVIDALSFTEAEAKTIKEFEGYVTFEITAIKKVNFAEIIQSDEEFPYHKAKMTFVTIDEKSGKETKASNNILVSAEDVKDAQKKIEEAFSGMTIPYEVESVAKTKIVEFWPYELK